jgi:ankyrin repeat protein
MQHDEEHFADGFAEYENFYGGPAFNYLAPAKSASSTTRELPAEDDQHKHHTSYDVAANAPEHNNEAEGLQLASAHSRYSLAPVPQGLMVDTRHQSPNTAFSTWPLVPAPLNYVQKAAGADFRSYQFPQTPSSPASQQGHGQQSPQDVSQPQALQPQPLQFLQKESIPPAPPMSFGSSASDEDGLSQRMQSMNVTAQYPCTFNLPPKPLRFTGNLPRMNTAGSISSSHSSSMISSPMQGLPGSPFNLSQRGYSISTINSLDNEGPEMSPSDAQAEVLRRLSSKERKGSAVSSFKKSFSLKRANTSAKTATRPSQDALTDVLEEAALEGSLVLVKAVVGMGADPVYRSTSKLKKVKHEALANATLNGRARVVDYLLKEGASYGEGAKKDSFSPTDRALLAAAYKGHADLIGCLIAAHGANPMIEQWPREMYDAQHYWAESQVRLAKTGALDGISKWKNVDQGMAVLKLIMQHPNFDPTALVSGVFDNKSELQSAEFAHRPWQTTYEYSALSCFVRAGWADAVEEMLSIKGDPRDYEKEDEVLQYQDKVTRYVSPINALTKETWEKRPEDALRILRLLIDNGFDVCLVQRIATDMGRRTALGRAISADASQGVELILQNKPSLVREEIFFRRNKNEIKALPLAAALSLDTIESGRVLLRAGAHPRDPALEDMNVLQFAAHQVNETGTAMLADMIGLAPELTYDALNFAIKAINKNAVRVLLDTISAAALRSEIAALPPVYDMILHCNPPSVQETKTQYLELIDMIIRWDAGYALQRPQLPAILSAIRKDNYVGMEKLLKLGVVDGKCLVLNSKAQPAGEKGLWTMLECCEITTRSSEWLGLLRYYGAPLYH